MRNNHPSARRRRPSPAAWPALRVTPGFAVLLGVLIALDPADLCLPLLAAAAVHELGHLTALRLCGVAVTELRFGALGAVIATEPMSPETERRCTAAGPFASLLGLCLLRFFPRFALLSGLLALANLLPVWPLDGGRIFRTLWPERAELVSGLTAAVLLLAGCLLAAVFHWGLWPLLLATALLGKFATGRLQEQKLVANRASGLYNRETTNFGGKP